MVVYFGIKFMFEGNNEKFDDLGKGPFVLVLGLAKIKPHRTKYGLDNDMSD